MKRREGVGTHLQQAIRFLKLERCSYRLEVANTEGEIRVFESGASEAGDDDDLPDGFSLLRLHFALPHAQGMIATYGDVLGIDSTHGTNDMSLSCFSVMVEDCNSNSHVVTCSILAKEDQPAIAAALQFGVDFFGLHPRTLVADKDMAEIGAATKNFPWVDAILCRYHVITYFRKNGRTLLEIRRKGKKAVCHCSCRRSVLCQGLACFSIRFFGVGR